MSTEATSPSKSLAPFEQLRYAREIIRTEGQALLSLADRVGEEFCRAIALIDCCRGSVIVSGMGKAGLVGQKIAATLASTGTRSHYLHPAEALHGDLGRIHRDDVALMLSFSGETEEIVALLLSLRQFAVPIVAMTGQPGSTLGQQATVTLDLGPLQEAGALRLAPSTSTTVMLALGDAIALVLSRLRGFGAEDFARFHPGGNLGKKLARVEDVMRPLDQCRLAEQSRSIREVLVALSRPGRRAGAIMVTDAKGILTGIFTDSDLARLLEAKRDNAIDGPLRDVMTRPPTTILVGSRLSQAHETMAQRKISELPVIDRAGKPRGLIDITDVVGILPSAWLAAQSIIPTQVAGNAGMPADGIECQILPLRNPG